MQSTLLCLRVSFPTPVRPLIRVVYASTSIYLGQGRDGVAGLVDVGDAERAGAAEDDDVEQGVGAEAVGAVHRGAAHFARREEARHHVVVVDDVTAHRVLLLPHHLRQRG